MRTTAALASPLFVVGLLVVGFRVVFGARLPIVEASCVLLAGCLLAALASARWLAAELAWYERCRWVFVAGVASVIAGWIWQRLVYLHFFPREDLRYGFFLTPAGAVPRFHLIEAPSATIATMLVLGAAATCVIAWRHGARWSLVSALMWWAVLELIGYIPTQNLMWQGDASLFI